MKAKTIAEMALGLERGDFSSTELTQHYLNRIKQFNNQTQAFITITEEQALAAAKQADTCIQNKQAGKLTGIPIAHKDIFCTKGIKTTCASKMLDNFIAPYNATVVEKLNNAGTVMLGKTNMDEFAMGSSNENSFYGAVSNPWDLQRVPGGSSGGSAATVAANLAPGVTGTDTGGSIRQPAAFCGVTGLKPTYGRVSRWGMIAFASSLDQAGPMARTAEDAALLLNAMAGFDEKDSTSANQTVPDFSANLDNKLQGMRIGIPKEYFAKGLDSGIEQAIQEAIKELGKLGCTFHDIELPNTKLAIPTYYVVASAECSSNLSRFDGVRYGYRCKNPEDLEDLYTRSRGEAFGSEVKRRIMLGTYVLSAGYYDAYYLKAQKVRRLIKQDFVDAFESVDLILSPTTPTTAFKKGEKSEDPITMYMNDIYTIGTNLAGLPGISIPAGFVEGLPVGLQLTAPYFEESRLLNTSHQFQQVTDWHQQTPDAFK